MSAASAAWREFNRSFNSDAGHPKPVRPTECSLGIELDAGAVVIHPAKEDVYVEVAEIRGFQDRAWMVWRPGEEGLEDLA
jgi:hypothetical protein